jgi:hypothetical protein
MDGMNKLISPALLVLFLLVCPARALDHVSFQRDGASQKVVGTVLSEAVDGGVLLKDRSGVLWGITSEELQERRSDNEAFKLYDADALATVLTHELSPGFRVHTTRHYVICYNTSQSYARWCGALFERLYLAFTNYWRQRGVEIQDPQGPLVALVFDDRNSYGSYARAELGNALPAIIGYYSLRTNRVTMYDLTGADRLPQNARITSADHINRILSRPQAERTVATIVHEATHQLAFNCGLQTRYADIPLWVSEGIAVFFETPDLKSKRGWRNIGDINRVRFAEFGRYLANRPADSLETLLSSDERFRNTAEISKAYAESWALTYFLLRKHRASFVAYLKKLSEKPRLIYDTPEQRLKDFQEVFGDDLQRLDAEFVRTMRSLRFGR